MSASGFPSSSPVANLDLATLRSLIASVRDYAIFMLDASGHIATWNTGAELIKGYTEAEIIGKPHSIFFDADAVRAGKPAALIARARETGRVEEEGWRVRKDGTRFWANVVLTTVLDEHGALVGFAKVTRDLTERREREEERARADAALHDAEETFRLAFENAPIGMALVALDGRWLRVNQAVCDLFGYSREELLSRSFQEITHAEDLADDLALVQSLLSGAIPRYELTKRYVRRDGSIVAASLHVSLVRDEAGKPRHFVSQIQDLTEMRRLRDRVVLADRMASLGTLAAGVAHEVNNPLAFVISNLEMLGEALPQLASADTALAREVEESLRYAREGCERVRRIVRDLNTFSRAEEHRRSPVKLDALLDLAIRMTANEIQHHAVLEKDFAEVPVIDGDPARLGQVFVNLLVNAAHALKEKADGAKQIRVETRTSATGDAIVEIHDTGPGIPAALLSRIFDPFFTTKQVGEGAGLGLSISHSIVSEHGGRIEVDSEIGRGSIFRVILPAGKLSARPPRRAATPAPASRAATVFVIDDDPLVAKTMARVLREHEVHIVTDARLALERIGVGEAVDVILCDLMMPNLTGMAFFAALQQSHPALAEQVIFMTGGAFTPEARAFVDTVSNPVLEKPAENDEIRALVRAAIRRAPGGASGEPG